VCKIKRADKKKAPGYWGFAAEGATFCFTSEGFI